MSKPIPLKELIALDFGMYWLGLAFPMLFGVIHLAGYWIQIENLQDKPSCQSG